MNIKFFNRLVKRNINPDFIYKYKSINNQTDLDRLIELLDSNKIYAPLYNELNDPFEGQIVNIELCGYAGMTMSLAADDEDMVVRGYKDRYRLLSFSDSPVNPLLWAHYAGNYTGICLCFSTRKSFKGFAPVKYCDKRETVSFDNDSDDSELAKCVMDSFFKKQKDWSYEREYRLVTEVDNKYLAFDDAELKGIVFGHNMPQDYKDKISSHVKQNTKKFKTRIGYRTFQVNILDYDYEYVYDGSVLKTIDIVKALES